MPHKYISKNTNPETGKTWYHYPEKRIGERRRNNSAYSQKRYLEKIKGKKIESRTESVRRWRANPENRRKFSAHKKVQRAIRAGRIPRETKCETCGDEPPRIHAHHEDYGKPLEIAWLCPSCHAKRHYELRTQGIPAL